MAPNMNRQKAIIVSGFSGVGKSSFARKYKGTTYRGYRVVDLDSGPFNALPGRPLERPPPGVFPRNYVEQIVQSAQKSIILLVSAHDNGKKSGQFGHRAGSAEAVRLVVRDRMLDAGLEYTRVYPDIASKAQFLPRLSNRIPAGASLPVGENDRTYQLVRDNWDTWITRLNDGTESEKRCKARRIALTGTQSLEDVMPRIVPTPPVRWYRRPLKNAA